MKLITESLDVEFLTEAQEGGGKKFFIEGIFMQGELKNRNGRVYPIRVLEGAVNKYRASHINENRAFGELNHPQGPTINLDKVSHLIKELRQEGNDFIGKAKILDTPMGKIVQTFIGEGVKPAVSSRGVGTLKPQNGANVVQEDFVIATPADIVADPSAPNAFTNGIMENAEWIYDAATGNFKALEHVHETRREFRKVGLSEIEQKQLKAWQTFLQMIQA